MTAEPTRRAVSAVVHPATARWAASPGSSAAAAEPAWVRAVSAARAPPAAPLPKAAELVSGPAVRAPASPPVHPRPAPPVSHWAGAGSDWAALLGFPAQSSQARPPPACPPAGAEQTIAADRR